MRSSVVTTHVVIRFSAKDSSLPSKWIILRFDVETKSMFGR